MIAMTGCPWPCITHGRVTSTSSEPAESLSLMRTWLNTCVDQHPSCRQTPKKLPTRVIDIGSCLSETLKFVESKKINDWYRALNHCWGGSQIVCTTRSTIKSYQSGMDLAKLPRGFRDAIDVARSLSVRYLWIDSLCIIQDNVQD
jgi:hypothetical protein